jgi:hypothetical protein
MNADPVERLRSRRPPRQAGLRADLVTCSLCLRVQRGSEWIEAERVIREIRSYELEALPHMQPAICAVCAESIVNRRMRPGDLSAA